MRLLLILLIAFTGCVQTQDCPISHKVSVEPTAYVHPADREPRFFSAGSGSGHHVGYDQDGNAIYGSGKPWKKGDPVMRR